MTATALIAGHADGPVLASGEGLSFWGGIDPATGRVIDAHHPWHGACVSGAVLMMPTSRGSCTGSGVLLDMALSGRAPAALVFSDAEDVLALGALVAGAMFDRPIPVLRVTGGDFARLSACAHLRITEGAILGGDVSVPVRPLAGDLALTAQDRAMLDGDHGPAVAQAMAILCAMARAQGASALVDVARAHIDGCIYASPANLTFATRMADLGARVRVPTTTNAISVDQANWRAQGVAPSFGEPAAALADAYLRMGCEASFTCAPYLLEAPPAAGEVIAWAESNAVIYANSVLGARTAKHPDFLDLCMAVTGRAPCAGVYLDAGRTAGWVIDVTVPEGVDDAVWPLLGWLAGEVAPDRIPLLRGVAHLAPSPDDLKALCAAFGTTSAAPMLHVEGVTPEAARIAPDADRARIGPADLARAWACLNTGGEAVDLVALGSPHASLAECRALAAGLAGRRAVVPVILTLGRAVMAAARADGVLDTLTAAGVRIIPDICWCSISEPVFPPATTTVMTNSGKYAHYGPGLSGRRMRFGGLAACIDAALTGRAPAPPAWTGDDG